MLTKTLEDTKTYDPVAATLGTMAGKAMQYKLFNTLAADTKYGKAAQAAGGKIGAAAQKIPGLRALVGDGFGDAAGRVLADTGADFVLDTLPSLASDVSEGKSAGEVTGNAAKNLVGNVAMNALPEIGSAVLNGVKNSFSGAMLDEPLQEAAAVAGKNSSLDTRPDLPRADTPAAVDLEKNADAFLRDVNSADAVKSASDSATSSIATASQNTAQSLADAADAPGGAVRERFARIQTCQMPSSRILSPRPKSITSCPTPRRKPARMLYLQRGRGRP